MKKRLLKEFLYFFTTIIIGLIAFHFAFNLSNLKTESVLDINVHDTYFVIEKKEILPIFCLSILYLFYLIKICFQKFKNQLSLSIFSIVSLIVILIFPTIIGFVKSLTTEPGWTVYPPLSSEKIEIKENLLSRIYLKIYSTYIALTLFGFYVFYISTRQKT
ncbi:MAG: hypothetical protein ACK5RV_04625 [Flavobacterium sp.]|jgi:heme/copper-type cytochrome/quinol oxidase subunit 1|uniref:hypothetical protein n=1 Tax=Flavobacterium sp. TaxID=239 RepID=UPI0022BB5C59|nr:hypothetical protein [Flavobacterium sp.]MCZ8170069.1 hypothetical protein [Flavobacterium sp.]MCZ8297090.1 hypothetical protein [Flavobacterium sp.]